VRVVFLGSPPFATPVLRRLLASSHDVVAVLTPPDRPRGRGRGVVASEVSLLAQEHGIELFQPNGLKDPADVERLRSFGAEALCVASYGEILRTEVLEMAPRGALNVHASLLPRWRGASPIQCAIAAGDPETGVSVQKMVLALDEGDVLVERRSPIGDRETSGDLLARLAEDGGVALVEALDALAAGTATYTPQDPALASHCRKLKKEAGRVDWSRGTVELDRHVRAMSPWPGAQTTLPDGRGLVVRAAQPSTANTSNSPAGSLIAGDAFTVATGDGALDLLTVQPAGKPAMDGSAFLRGARIEAGLVLGSPTETDA
jgi:methionyl-tRNA formyltransferase